MDKPLLCSFAGYVSEAGGRVVQEWYDSLPEVERDEIKDTLNYLASIPPLNGEDRNSTNWILRSMRSVAKRAKRIIGFASMERSIDGYVGDSFSF
jgi:hypothetical protein